MVRPLRIPPSFLILATLVGCGGGGGESPGQGDGLPAGDGPPEFVFVRSRRDAADRDTALRRSLLNGLANERILSAAGVESGLRVHPDGNRLVYARERRTGQPATREVFTGSLDGSLDELRLTVNGDRDEMPDWSRDGTRIVYVSDRLGSGPRLFEAMADGSGAVALHDEGFDQLDPDWSPVDDRIVYSRIEGGLARLFVLQTDRRVSLPLTDGGPGIAGTRTPGDYQACWGPDGSAVWFTRVLDEQSAVLCRVEVASGSVTVLTAPTDDAARPRVSPDGAQLLFTMARPTLGMTGQRLWRALADGSAATLLFPDQRYDYLGIDMLPAFPAVESDALEAVPVEIAESAIRNGLGTRTRGTIDNVLEPDDVLYGLGTVPSGGREIAGIDLGVALPVDDPFDLRGVEVVVRAGVGDAVPGDILRVAVRNATERRNDTVVEAEPTGAIQTIRFTLASLAHIDRDRGFGIAVIADKGRDQPGELLIDSIALTVTRPVVDPGTTSD